MDQRVYYTLKARFANEAQRYDDMFVAMKKLSQLPDVTDFCNNEIHLFQKSFRKVVADKRISWRKIRDMEKYERSLVVDGFSVDVVRRYRLEIEAEVRDMCEEMINLINDSLFKKAEEKLSKIFYQQLQGDCYRYLAEMETNKDERIKMGLKAAEVYKSGMALANSFLSSINPFRLSVASNYAILLKDIFDNADDACELMHEVLNNVDVKESPLLSEKDLNFSLVIIDTMTELLQEWTLTSGLRQLITEGLQLKVDEVKACCSSGESFYREEDIN